jgi:hypothetical protein
VLCLIAVRLLPGRNKFAVKINNNNNNYATASPSRNVVFVLMYHRHKLLDLSKLFISYNTCDSSELNDKTALTKV